MFVGGKFHCNGVDVRFTFNLSCYLAFNTSTDDGVHYLLLTSVGFVLSRMLLKLLKVVILGKG